MRKSVPSRMLKVGDMVVLEKNMRVPADMVLLRTSETVGVDPKVEMKMQASLVGDVGSAENVVGEEGGNEGIDEGADSGGTCFIRTDQLDGETDWKLRIAVGKTQPLSDQELLNLTGELYADPPSKDIHTFIGNLTIHDTAPSSSSRLSNDIHPLSADNILWANTVLAAGSAVGMVVYTGKETRASMNTSEPETKVGLLDVEINRMAKVTSARGV